jgi:hypothetical protein
MLINSITAFTSSFSGQVEGVAYGASFLQSSVTSTTLKTTLIVASYNGLNIENQPIEATLYKNKHICGVYQYPSIISSEGNSECIQATSSLMKLSLQTAVESRIYDFPAYGIHGYPARYDTYGKNVFNSTGAYTTGVNYYGAITQFFNSFSYSSDSFLSTFTMDDNFSTFASTIPAIYIY